MTANDASGPSDVGQILAAVLARVPKDRRPLLIAMAERMAAARYRAWAADPTVAAHASALRTCAEREDEIAGRVEGLYPDAAALQRELTAAHPDLGDIDRVLFAGRPLAEQFAMQAGGERLGAATWRAFAAREPDARRSGVLRSCAELEEASAEVLEALLRTA
jgi:hypothetical protein